ncbi:MAG TPA: NADH-quinone oxidoreductase subunit N, partial [Actinomycetota bacterium]|nr:NADH-quinone oxidoreductase subunit N [Actinomycetota bacterium]
MPTPAVELGPILPELILVGVGVALLIAGVALRKAELTALLVLCLGGIAAAAVASVRLWDWEG